MTQAFMFAGPEISIYPKDMTLDAHTQLGDFGARRRR
jgi:hypothetical protein